jgi:aminoglycoside phosphotransferase (APT) family kinase protein
MPSSWRASQTWKHSRASVFRSQLEGHLASVPRVARFLEDLDAYLALIAECALPDALVHGDFHPGNVRSDGSTSTILDWGDSFLGNPGFDLLRLCEGCSEADAASLSEQWSFRWRQHRSSCNPERAVTLLGLLAPLRAAATYARFVAHIEPSEHPFHAPDVIAQLNEAERLLEGERIGG